jgi:hypothetical protein
LKHDKLVPPCFDRKLLDEQAVKYALANKKWKARITSKNPSLAIEEDGMRGATQSIYGGVVVFGVNDKQAATSTLICHPSSEYLATHRAQGTTGTVPSAINFSTLCKSPSVTSYILPADSQDILAALAIVVEKTDSHEKRFRCC